MVVRNGGARFLDRVENGGVVAFECVRVIHLGDEDEVQVRALRVAVGHVRGHDGVGQRVADLAHVAVHLRHVRPVHGAFQRVGDDAEIHERVAQIRVVEAALFPALCDIARHRHCAVLECDLGNVFCYVLGKALFAVCKA